MVWPESESDVFATFGGRVVHETRSAVLVHSRDFRNKDCPLSCSSP